MNAATAGLYTVRLRSGRTEVEYAASGTRAEAIADARKRAEDSMLRLHGRTGSWTLVSCEQKTN